MRIETNLHCDGILTNTIT